MDGKYSVNVLDTRIINGHLYIKIGVSTPKRAATKTSKTDDWHKWIQYGEATNYSDKVKKFDEGKS